MEEERNHGFTQKQNSAVQCLLRCGAKVSAATITTNKLVGLRQLSAIDCLVHHHGYRWVRETTRKQKEENE